MTIMKKLYAQIACKSAAFSAIAKAIDLGRESHAYLLEGEDTTLSLAVALSLISYELSGKKADFSTIEAMRTLGGEYGDVYIYGSDGFKVEDANAVVRESLITPSELSKKYFILLLDGANETAQNKLLKTLEEAPLTCMYYVLVQSVKDILPTIASRTEVVASFIREPFLQELNDQTMPNYAYAAYMGNKSLTTYEQLINGKNVPQLEDALEIFSAIINHNELKAATSLPSNREQAAHVLKYMEHIMSDVLNAHMGERVYTYGLYNIDEYKERFSFGGIARILFHIRRAVERLPNANMTALADMLVMNIADNINE